MPYRHDDARERERARLAAELAALRDEPRSAERAAREADLAASVRALALPSPARRLPALRLLPRLRIASPCGEDWHAMVGDARVRRCSRCEKNVFDLSAMTALEAEALLAAHVALPEGGLPCVRLYRRSDGTILTSDCVEGTGARRVVQTVAATALLVGATVTASALAPEERPPHYVHYALPRIEAPPLPPEPPSDTDWFCLIGGCVFAPELEELMGSPVEISAEEVSGDRADAERPHATRRTSRSRRRRAAP